MGRRRARHTHWTDIARAKSIVKDWGPHTDSVIVTQANNGECYLLCKLCSLEFEGKREELDRLGVVESKRVWAMGGCLTRDKVKWNKHCDSKMHTEAAERTGETREFLFHIHAPRTRAYGTSAHSTHAAHAPNTRYAPWLPVHIRITRSHGSSHFFKIAIYVRCKSFNPYNRQR